MILVAVEKVHRADSKAGRHGSGVVRTGRLGDLVFAQALAFSLSTISKKRRRGRSSRSNGNSDGGSVAISAFLAVRVLIAVCCLGH
ncbi:hypothetical protein Nepgr_014935 [Nepenthes gracilis]|uniref:Uncharacterized protein n=1 Tax=Nepenthes gracilis TaxID=150966 RepID=A0AAD3XQM7_NEPGR|nr:hypothetical protein Nepgr_014935 [Nepenthes gracilis]